MLPAAALKKLVPTGVLRCGVNMSNFLLVSSRGPNGEPRGVVPDLARALADDLGVPLELLPFDNPGLLTDAADSAWDVCFIGNEPARAASIAFTEAYAEIAVTYLVPAGSALRSVAEVDAPGVRIAVAARGAFDLFLTAYLKHATLRRTAADQPVDRLRLSRELFVSESLDALAGLQPWLLDQAVGLPGAAVLDGSFTSVQQSIGTPRSRGGEATPLLEHWVAVAKASGLVQSLIARHGVTGKLSVPAGSDAGYLSALGGRGAGACMRMDEHAM